MNNFHRRALSSNDHRFAFETSHRELIRPNTTWRSPLFFGQSWTLFQWSSRISEDKRSCCSTMTRSHFKSASWSRNFLVSQPDDPDAPRDRSQPKLEKALEELFPEPVFEIATNIEIPTLWFRPMPNSGTAQPQPAGPPGSAGF